MVPFVLSPPGVPFTDQFTDWFVVPVTVAKNCWVSPVRTVAVVGVTVTAICCGGGPELLHPQINNTTNARRNDNQRLDMSHSFLLHPGSEWENPVLRCLSRNAIPSHDTTRGVNKVASPLPLRPRTGQASSFPLETLALSGYRHSGIVHVDQAPSTLYFLIQLCFPTVGREGRAVFSGSGNEIPIELSPSCVPVHMNGNVMNAQFAFREHLTHQARVDVLLDLLEAMFVAQRMDEGHVWRIQPDLSSERGVRGVNRFRVFLNQVANNCHISGRFRGRNIPECFLFFSFCAGQRGFRHDLFDFTRISGEAFAQQFVAGFGDEKVLLDAHAKIFLGNVDAGLDGNDHPRLEPRPVAAAVVDVQANMVPEPLLELS